MAEDKKQLAERLNRELNGKTAQEVIAAVLPIFGNKIALASSLGLEDQVLTHMLVKHDKNARIFTIDTGRLFPETYLLIDKTCMTYNTHIEVFFPERKGVEDYVRQNGINAFYESIEKRKECCHCRKLEPLKRALSELDAWICGLRNQQSVTRTNVQTVEWDENNGLIKINPLIHWSEDDVERYISDNAVPVNTLFKQGFISIGCQPCTRAIKPGEDIRAGRWWWEDPAHKECGLHAR